MTDQLKEDGVGQKSTSSMFFRFSLGFVFSFLFMFFLLNYQNIEKVITHSKGDSLIKNFENLPQNEWKVNGSIVKVSNGISALTKSEFIEQFKSERKENSNTQIVHEANSGDRTYLTYKENGVFASLVVTAKPDDTCSFQIYSSDEKILNPSSTNLKKDIPLPEDAVMAMALEGDGSHQMVSFTTNWSESKLVRFYQEELSKIGWAEELYQLPDNLQVKEIESRELMFYKNKKSLHISISLDPIGSGLLVCILTSL